jgi:serine/threonine-protein kinase
MAPEQLEGGEPGPSSDVYALAAVCFEALTGERPRRGRTAIELAHRMATEPPPDLRDHLPGAPAGAAEALRRGMARDPAERPASAGELASELASALEGGDASDRAALTRAMAPRAPVARPRRIAPQRPLTPPPPPVAQRPAPPARRGRTPVALIPVILLVLAAAAAAGVLLSNGGGDGAGADRPSGERPAQPDQANDRAGSTGTAEKTTPDKAKPQKAKSKKTKPEAIAPPAATPAPPPATAVDATRGTQLNGQGYALMQQGDYAGAVPVLQQAVASWSEDSADIGYAYALFNLGKSLNRSGRSAEAIPYLEKRLRWDDQRDTVQAELDLARKNAGQG